MATTVTPKAWADACRQDKWWSQRPEVLLAIDELQALLQDDKSSQAVAQIVTAIYEPIILNDSRDATLDVAQLWGVLCHAARAFGGGKTQAERLADFLIAVQACPDVKDRAGNAVLGGYSSQRFWRDLPGFGVHFRQYGNFECYEGFYTVFGEDWEVVTGDWYLLIEPSINATAFAATYLARQEPHPAGNYHAETTLSAALEDQGNSVSKQDLRIEAAYLRAAATWMLIAGERIYGMCQANDDPDSSKFRLSTASTRWMGLGFFPLRWRYWKDRFQSLAERTELDMRCRNMAVQAVEQMDGVSGT